MIAKAPFARWQLLRLMAGAVCFAVWLTACAAHAAAPLRIDLTPAPPAVLTVHLGLGSTNASGGRTLGADSQCLYRDGQPFIPVMGEFHFTRYPASEWREALLKMKAGGIDIVATYVFWIHHEEVPGQWDWSGRRSLRDFLKTCKELELLAIVRLGPWSHGEVRNGGFPDWVANAAFWPEKGPWKNRDTHPEFMRLTTALYQQIATQLQGLLWKDGGPVIGVQHDNECWNLPYLHALKKLARDCGLDVPFYTMTGWNAVPIPDEGLLPLFGGYADGFWMDDPTGMRKAFLFTPIRDDGDMGAIGGRLTNTRPERNTKIQRFPYLCCEIGGGMPSSYRNRIHVTPADVTSLALVKLGEGNNLPGYYMYHGGVNPEGKLTTLNETRATGYPNDLPVKDYDFGPLSAAGQAREHYFLLRQQHLFLRDFGVDLARMPAFFPEQMPATLDDTNTVRWCVRSDGAGGFLFFNNHQRYQQLPAKAGVQFALQAKQGEQVVPRQPVTLPPGAYGFWPVNLDCTGVRLDYATAQPLCRLAADGQHWFFLAALEGIAPEIAVAGEKPKKLKAGSGVALSRKAADGSKVNFVVLTPEQGRQLWKLPLAGRDRVVLSPNTLLPETPAQVTLEALAPAAPALAVFPPVAQASIAGRAVKSKRDGIFQRFSFTGPAQEMAAVECPPVRSAVATTNVLNAMDESAWTNAAVWRVRVPTAVAARESLLRIHYVGDVARIYAGGRLVLDNFYNGQPFDVPLWRLSPAELASLEIHVLPWRAGTPHRIAAEAKPRLEDDRPAGELLRVESIPLTRVVVSLGEDRP
jgi:hypothetical protein